MKKILILDDEKLITETLSNLIELMLEYEVVAYNNPEEALADSRLNNRQIDMVISDFMMPKLNGFDFLKQVQQIHPQCTNILLTGYADKDQAIQCINELELYYYLEKPWHNDDLIKVIENGFEKKRLETELADKIIELEKANHDISKLYDLLKEDYHKEVNKLDTLRETKMDLERTVVERNFALRNILDEVKQGFLVITENLRVQPEYSKACIGIFSRNIDNSFFPELVYEDDLETRNSFSDLIVDLLTTQDHDYIDLLLPLLPDEAFIHGKLIKLEFKLIEKNKLLNDKKALMVVLTNVEKERLLELKVENEKNALKMVVEVFNNYNTMKEFLRDFKMFNHFELNEILEQGDIKEVFRKIHTFKGISSQLQLVNTTKNFHDLEQKIIDYSLQDDITLIQNMLRMSGVENYLDEDLSILSNYLGEDFLTRDVIVITHDELNRLKKKLREMLPETYLKEVLFNLNLLTHQSLKEIIMAYKPYIEQLALEAGKEISFEVEGDELMLDYPIYADFSKSLVHIFRNMVEHGIERPEERKDHNKPVQGRIVVKMTLNDMIEVQLLNDGRMIDEKKLIDKGLAAGFKEDDLLELTQGDMKQLVFEDFISTKDEVTPLSGRGVGLSAVRREVERLNGQMRVESNPQETSFIITLPIKDSKELLAETIEEELRIFLTDMKLTFEKLDSNITSKTCDITAGDMLIGIGIEKKVLDHIREVMDYGGEISDEDILLDTVNTIVGHSIRRCHCELGVPTINEHTQLMDRSYQCDLGKIGLSIEMR